MAKQLRGILSALATPFDRQGQLNLGALRELVDGQLAAGIHGLIPCGSTGEFTALTLEERMRVVEIVIEQANGRAPVVPQTGHTSTAVAIELSRHAQRAGADAIMVVHPYYEPLSLDEVFGYFADIAAAVDLPLMVYNIPSCTGMNLPPAFLAKLAQEIPTVRYVKDSSGDLSQISELLYRYGDVVTTFNGWDTLTFSGLALGSPGAVWGAANCLPRQCAELFELVAAGRLAEAKALWDRLWPVQHFLVTEGYIASVKAGANLLGFAVGDPRPPFRPLAPDKQQALARLLEQAGALEPGRQHQAAASRA